MCLKGLIFTKDNIDKILEKEGILSIIYLTFIEETVQGISLKMRISYISFVSLQFYQ